MRNRRTLDTQDALILAEEVLRLAQEGGYQVSCTVVDASGVILLQVRDTFAGPHTLVASGRKAFTALSQKRPTGEIQQGIEQRKIPREILSLDERLTSMPGGLPIVDEEGHLLGGIGVGGAHGEEDVRLASGALSFWKTTQENFSA